MLYVLFVKLELRKAEILRPKAEAKLHLSPGRPPKEEYKGNLISDNLLFTQNPHVEPENKPLSAIEEKTIAVNQRGRRNIPDYARIKLELRKAEILRPLAQARMVEASHPKIDKEVANLISDKQVSPQIPHAEPENKPLSAIEEKPIAVKPKDDENLIRADLHFIDRGDHLKRRKEIYELKYPETKREATLKQYRKVETTERTEPSFVKDTAQKIGQSESTIKQEIQISSNLSSEIKEQVKKADLSKTEPKDIFI